MPTVIVRVSVLMAPAFPGGATADNRPSCGEIRLRASARRVLLDGQTGHTAAPVRCVEWCAGSTGGADQSRQVGRIVPVRSPFGPPRRDLGGEEVKMRTRVRGWRWRRNPLRRRSDVVEAWTVLRHRPPRRRSSVRRRPEPLWVVAVRERTGTGGDAAGRAAAGERRTGDRARGGALARVPAAAPCSRVEALDRAGQPDRRGPGPRGRAARRPRRGLARCARPERRLPGCTTGAVLATRVTAWSTAAGVVAVVVLAWHFAVRRIAARRRLAERREWEWARTGPSGDGTRLDGGNHPSQRRASTRLYGAEYHPS